MSCEPTPCNNTSTSSWCTMCGGHSLSRPQMTTDPNLALGYPIPIMIKTRYSCEMFSFSVDSHSQPPVLKWNRLFLAFFLTTTSELYSCAVKNTNTQCSTPICHNRQTSCWFDGKSSGSRRRKCNRVFYGFTSVDLGGVCRQQEDRPEKRESATTTAGEAHQRQRRGQRVTSLIAAPPPLPTRRRRSCLHCKM